jgi:dihydroflavonol-4-reductase
MDIAITGASGFIGAHVVEAALRRGHRPRILVRRPCLTPAWREAGVREFVGDVRDESALRPFLEGAEAFCHVAGVNTPSSNRREDIMTSNVEGAAGALRLAHRLGVKRLIHTGSTAARGCKGRSQVNDEDTPFNLWNASTDYEKSKYLGEKAAQDLYEQEGAPVIVVEPGACVGPGDRKPTFTGKLILDVIRGRMPGYFEMRHNFVDVRDVAEGHLLALEKGRLGQRYLLCGDDDMLLTDYFALISELTGAPPVRLKVPLWLAFPLAYANHVLWRVTGMDPLVRVSTVKRAWLDLRYTNAKARRELGFAPRPLRTALRDGIAWFLANGMLDPSELKHPLPEA